MADITISEWITGIIDGPGGLHDYERCELASPTVPRDEAVAAWVIRCLANPRCEDSDGILAAIQEQREKCTKKSA
jgi:hypothetical protein